MTEQAFSYKQNFWRKFKKKFDFIYDIHSVFYFGLLLVVISVLFFILPLINANFSTLYTGDYTMQYVAMGYNQYDDWHHFFQTGTFVFWDPNTFLGADNITSNAYYYLFSPFFIPIVLFPRDFVPQAMAILSIVRITFGGLVFRLYLKKMFISERSARIGALAYAFSGWMAWYLWFNNFLDIVALFPLILLGIEKVLQNKKPWLLAFSLFLLAISNFFLLPALTVCAFIYAMWRYFTRLKLNNWKSNFAILGIGFCGFAVGLIMGMVIFYPSFIASTGSSRYTGASYLDNLLQFYKNGDFNTLLKLAFSWEQSDPSQAYRAYYPLINFFVPPLSDRGTPLLDAGYDMMSGSLWSAAPITMLLVPAVINSIKEKKFGVFVPIVFFMFALFSPFISYALFGFTTAYLRWSIFLNTSLITYVSIYLDKMKDAPKWTLNFGVIFTVLGIIGAGLTANYLLKEYSSVFSVRWSIMGTCAIEIAYVLLIYFFIRFFYDKKYLNYILLGIVAVESIAIGSLVSYGHGYFSSENKFANNGASANRSLTEVITNINNNDKTYFRTYTSLNNGYSSNNGMMNNYNGMQMFHTLYNYNTKDFKWWTGWSDGYNGWSAYYMGKRANLDAFLGVKYYVVKKDTTKADILADVEINVPLNAVKVKELENEDFYVYKNERVSTLGYSYDKIIGYIDDDTQSGANTFINRTDYLNILMADQMYLETAIVKEEIKDKILSLVGDDIALYEKKSYFNPSFTGFDDIVRNNNPTSGYKRTIYTKTETNNLEFDPNNIGQIPNNLSNYKEYIGLYPFENDNYYIFITREDKGTFDFDEGTAIYINSPYINSQKVDVYLLDNNGKVITYDNHGDDTYTTGISQGLRGFYAKRPVKSIVIIPRFNKVPSINIAIETGANINQRIGKLEPLENVNYVSTNEFTFKTNYDKYRYVVTTIPYEKGWKVLATDAAGQSEYLNVYKSQGGFVGFLAQTGETIYDMKYMNDDLVTGSIISAVGTFIFISSYAIFIIIEKTNKKKRPVRQE